MAKKTTSKSSKPTDSAGLNNAIRTSTQKVSSSEQKILIVMEGIRAELSVAELCRKHGISQPTFYKWTKDFVEAGKKRLSGDELREATSDEVKEIRKENTLLKESLADLVIRNVIVKKSLDLLD